MNKGYIFSGYQEVFAYKIAMLISLFVGVIAFLIQYYIWSAVFNNPNNNLSGVESNIYLLYVSGGLFLSIIYAHNVDRRLSKGIRTGNIIFDLLRPFQLISGMLSYSIGRQLGYLWTLIPLILISLIYIDFSSIELETLLLFVISVFLAFLVGFQITIGFGILAFYTTNSWGLFVLRRQLLPLLSGQIVAFDIMAQISQNDNVLGKITFILNAIYPYLPFQATFYIPSGILSGLISSDVILNNLGIQLFWFLFLWMVNHVVLKILLKKFSVQGA